MKEAQGHQDDELLGKAYDARLIRRLLRYIAPYRWWVAASLLLLFLTTAMQLLGPYITKIAIDTHIAARDLHGLNLAVLAYLITVLVGFISQYARAIPYSIPASGPCMTSECRSLPTCNDRTSPSSTGIRSGG